MRRRSPSVRAISASGRATSEARHGQTRAYCANRTSRVWAVVRLGRWGVRQECRIGQRCTVRGDRRRRLALRTARQVPRDRRRCSSRSRDVRRAGSRDAGRSKRLLAPTSFARLKPSWIDHRARAAQGQPELAHLSGHCRQCALRHGQARPLVQPRTPPARKAALALSKRWDLSCASRRKWLPSSSLSMWQRQRQQTKFRHYTAHVRKRRQIRGLRVRNPTLARYTKGKHVSHHLVVAEMTVAKSRPHAWRTLLATAHNDGVAFRVDVRVQVRDGELPRQRHPQSQPVPNGGSQA